MRGWESDMRFDGIYLRLYGRDDLAWSVATSWYATKPFLIRMVYDDTLSDRCGLGLFELLSDKALSSKHLR